LFRSKNLARIRPQALRQAQTKIYVLGIDKVTSARRVEPTPGIMRASNSWLAGASAGVMLMVVEAVCAELTSDNNWVQAYGRQDKDCLEWNDTCVNCVRAQSGGDYSCSNVGIACQPKGVRCMRRADERRSDPGAAAAGWCDPTRSKSGRINDCARLVPRSVAAITWVPD
jgi:hypothetical protein